VLAGVAPDRLELTSFSPQFRAGLPDLARRIGKAPLLRWQAQLKGSEQQLRQSVQPRLWLEVLLLGLLAEPQARAMASERQPQPATAAAVATPTAVATAPAPSAVHASPAPPVVAPPPPPAAPAVPPAAEAPSGAADLSELWQQILAGLELPSTRMLLSQQAQLARLDQQRAVVQVAGNWMAMVQSRLPLLEKAVAATLGSPRQVVLEAGGAPPPVAPAPARPAPAPPAPAPAIAAPAPPPAAPVAPAPSATAPPAAPPTTATAALPTTPAPTKQEPEAPTPSKAEPALIDDQARRLAEFFNGEVVQLDGPMPELENPAA
jgi:DNA polymerase-3 subunit gamma/tau